MTELVELFLILAPLVALLGGGVLVALALLHLSRRRPLPGIAAGRVLPAVASLLLGLACAGLGGTFLLTGGETGHDRIYLFWLAVAAASGLLSLLPQRG